MMTDLFSSEVDAGNRCIRNMIGRIRKDVLAEKELSEVEIALAEAFFDCMIDRESKAIQAGGLSHNDADVRIQGNPVGEGSSSSAALLVLGVATSILIIAIVAGWTTLSVIMALLVGGAGVFLTYGRASELHPVWPRSPRPNQGKTRDFTRREDNPERETSTRERERAVTVILDEVESKMRCANRAILRVRQELEAKRDAASNSATRQPTLEMSDAIIDYLQDLAQAGITEDEVYALKLAQRRLSLVMLSIGLEFISYSKAQASCFTVDHDGCPDESRSVVKTIRPAVMHGGKCLSSGYAKMSA